MEIDVVGEEWRPIKGWEGLYDVSNMGRVRRLYAGGEDGWRILKPGINKTGTGYYQVHLKCDGKEQNSQLVHILVAEAFIGPRPLGMLVLHDNGKSLDCRLTNLYYGTHKQNMDDRVRHGTSNRGERHGLSKVTDKVAREIKLRYQMDGSKKLAEEFGVTQRLVARIGLGQTYKHIVV